MAAGVLVLRSSDTSEAAGNAPVAAPPTVAISTPVVTLDRQQLLAMISAYSLSLHNTDQLAAKDGLAGKRIQIDMPVACALSALDPGEWSYEQDTGRLKVQVQAVDFAQQNADFAVQSLQSDRLIGFYVARPWRGSASCPSVNSEDAAAIPASNSVAIAEQVSADAPRSDFPSDLRFEIVKNVEANRELADIKLHLRIDGRILPDDPITCRERGADKPPFCIVNVQFERIAIIDSTRSDVVGEWEQ